MDYRQPSKTEQLIALLTALTTLAAVAWQMVPEHDRRLAAMRATASLRGLLARAALGLGHEGMRNELGGQSSLAGQHYGAALHLSRLRDRLTVTLDRMRP